MANEVVKSFSEKLTDKLVAEEMALPKNFNRERFVRNCLTVMNEKPELARINKAEVIQGLCKGAYLGLDFFMGECYLVPYQNKIRFQTDYKGEVKYVKKYSTRPIEDLYAQVVREGDFFEVKIADGRSSVNFKPLPFNGNDIIGAFAVVLYKDGGMRYEEMSAAEINSVRNVYGSAPNSKAWKSSWGEMAKKTVIRRLCKHIDKSFESTEAKMAWEEGAETNITVAERSEELVDAFAEEEVIDVDFREVEEDVSDMPDVDVFK